MTQDPAILRAERLRALMSMPEWEHTVGKWIDESVNSALHLLSTATEPHDVHRAQGAYATALALKEQFNHVFAAEKVAVAKKQRKSE